MSASPASAPPHERLSHIEQRLRGAGSVRTDELAHELAVSEMTIRRDLDELEALGVARRVRGGAVPIGPEPFAQRHRHNARAKAAIAAKVHDLLPASGVVAFDASSTVHRVASTLDIARDLTVVTNGLDTFDALQGRAGVQATLTGGTVDARTGSLVGPVAGRGARDHLYDVFVCSAAAVDPDLGSSEATLAEAEVKRVFAAASRRCVLAVDHTKLGTRASARMFELGELDVLVTDLPPGDPRLGPYRATVELR
ncbi:MAG TPA: DeoR/GlpR family DNA-binding transcription regulator [Nitriliruptorales bacterium]